MSERASVSGAVPPVRAAAGGTLHLAALAPYLATLAALAFWEFASGRIVNSYFVSKPSAIAAQIYEWLASGYIQPHIVSTFEVTLAGFVVAAAAAVVLALVLAVNPLVDEVLTPFIYMAFSLPKIALAPLLIFWTSVGKMPPLLLAAVTAFFLVFFNAYTGIRGVSPALVKSVTLMGANPLALALKVRLPAAAPHVVHGLCQGLIYAFHGAIVGEMTASNVGIGYVLVYAATDMDSTAVLAGLAVLGVISYALVTAIERAARRVPGGSGAAA
ncbi:MAG: ABC transporter permease [Betaproteobacteria bacterium]